MSDPIMVLLAGPNGAGKSTLFQRVISKHVTLPFINADEIAAEQWPEDTISHAAEASAAAAARRAEFFRERKSFSTETVFSHLSKLELIEEALALGYIVDLHVVWVPEDLAVARVAHRVELGTTTGHGVPEEKIRGRYQRLWQLVAQAANRATTTTVYDNSGASPRIIGRLRDGEPVGAADMPAQMPVELRPLFEQNEE